MGQDEVNAGILFVDVCDSTKLYAAMSADEARTVILRTLDFCAQAAGKYGGVVIDRIGDEIMCRFETAPEVCRAAIDMQRAVADASLLGTLPKRTFVRVGFHFGPVLMQDGAVFGDTVHTARRFASLAKAQQILTHSDVLAQCVQRIQASGRFVDRLHVKGKSEELEVSEVFWEENEVTMIAARGAVSARAAPRRSSALVLRLGSVQMQVDSGNPELTLGRGAAAEFEVSCTEVSRLHARIEWDRGCVFLQDMSTNGTIVSREGEAQNVLYRERDELTGHGTICLGRAPAPGRENVIAFEVVCDEPSVSGPL